jgi:hypothetical protein
VDDNTSAECLSTRLTQGLAEGRECAIRLDARRLSDEVAQCFNLAKIKKRFHRNELALQTYRRVPPSIYRRLLAHAISTMLLVALAVVETWYLLTSTHRI